MGKKQSQEEKQVKGVIVGGVDRKDAVKSMLKKHQSIFVIALILIIGVVVVAGGYQYKKTQDKKSQALAQEYDKKAMQALKDKKLSVAIGYLEKEYDYRKKGYERAIVAEKIFGLYGLSGDSDKSKTWLKLIVTNMTIAGKKDEAKRYQAILDSYTATKTQSKPNPVKVPSSNVQQGPVDAQL